MHASAPAGNDLIAASARRHHFDQMTRLPLLCECGDAGCQELIRVTLLDFDDARSLGCLMVAAGHISGGELVRRGETFDLHRRRLVARA
jgi:hypothetical protein